MCHAELGSASHKIINHETLKQVQGDKDILFQQDIAI
jgi:hypothetical protein